MEFSIFDHVNRSWQVVKEWVQELILYQFVVSSGTWIEWNISDNGQSTYEEMHFESCKKSCFTNLGYGIR